MIQPCVYHVAPLKTRDYASMCPFVYEKGPAGIPELIGTQKLRDFGRRGSLSRLAMEQLHVSVGCLGK